MDDRHKELLVDLLRTDIKDRQKIRKIHRELKKFGDGVPFTTMYQRELMILNFILIAILIIRIFS